MRFRDLSQSAVQRLWEKWKHVIRALLEEFNADVFNGKGQVRENACRECLYLLLETKNGCLYIFPLPGDKLCLRLYKHKLEKVDPTLLAALSKEGQENYVGGFRVDVDMIEKRHSLISREFRQGMEGTLRILYRELWTSLMC